jgi:hypothetical protein
LIRLSGTEQKLWGYQLNSTKKKSFGLPAQIINGSHASTLKNENLRSKEK